MGTVAKAAERLTGQVKNAVAGVVAERPPAEITMFFYRYASGYTEWQHERTVLGRLSEPEIHAIKDVIHDEEGPDEIRVDRYKHVSSEFVT